MAVARIPAVLAAAAVVLGGMSGTVPASAEQATVSGAAAVQLQSTLTRMSPTNTVSRRGLKVYTARVSAVTGPATYNASVKIKAVNKPSRARITLRQLSGNRVIASRTVAVRTRHKVRTAVPVVLRTSSEAQKVEVVIRYAKPRKRTVRVSQVRISRRITSTPANSGTALPTAPASTTQSPAAITVPSTPSATALPGWRSDVTEDFDSLSASRWNVKNNTFATNESSYLLARNVSAGNGLLRVQGKPEAAGGRLFTSGRIDTNGKYALPNYFRAEVRAKVPFEQGMWSAPLWFRPTGGGMGEIDLIETYGGERANPKVHQTIHNAYGVNHTYATTAKPFARFSNVAASDWHVYTIEKTRGHIKMWVDGHLTADFSAASAAWFNRYYESGQRWNLRVNMQIGGTYGLPDATTKWNDTTMQLDYIKTWVPN